MMRFFVVKLLFFGCFGGEWSFLLCVLYGYGVSSDRFECIEIYEISRVSLFARIVAVCKL
jgi:hypothetical protein